MNTLKNSKTTKYTLAAGALIIASSAVAAVISTINAPSQFTPATPTDSFALDDGMATKEISQLEWSRCLVGQTFSNGTCTGTATEFTTWESALAAPTVQQAADGWRVPNVKELVRITENTQAFPAINTEVFPFGNTLTFDTQKAQYGGGTFPSASNSPYIWSSTPVVQKTITRGSSFQELTPEESAQKTMEARENMELTYAMDLALGEPQKIYRSGESIGERFEGQFGNSDPNNAKKARYVLLVKDVS